MKGNKNNYGVALNWKIVFNGLQTQLFKNLQAIDQELNVSYFKENRKTLAGKAIDELSDAIFQKQGNGLKTAEKWVNKFYSALNVLSNSEKEMKESAAYEAAIQHLEGFINAVNQLKTKNLANNNTASFFKARSIKNDCSDGKIDCVKALKEFRNIINDATLSHGFCNKTAIKKIKDWASEKENEGYETGEIQFVLQSFFTGCFSENSQFLNALQEDGFELFQEIRKILPPPIASNKQETLPTEIDCSKLSILNNNLGKGSFSVVAQGQYNNGSVAIKFFNYSNVSEYSTNFESFKKEVIFMNQLNSPYIVKLIAFCSDNLHLALVMEYVPHGTLNQLLRYEPNCPFQTFYRIAIDVAHGLATIHQANIIHADLKIDNILINREYRAKICDFGLSSYENESLGSRGTPTYFPPEFFFGQGNKKADQVFNSKCSDVYAYGMILLALIIQEEPFGDVWSYSLLDMVSVLSTRLRRNYNSSFYSGAIEFYENEITSKLKQQSFIPSPQEDSAFYQAMLYCCHFSPKDRPQIEDVRSRLLVEYHALNSSP